MHYFNSSVNNNKGKEFNVLFLFSLMCKNKSSLLIIAHSPHDEHEHCSFHHCISPIYFPFFNNNNFSLNLFYCKKFVHIAYLTFEYLFVHGINSGWQQISITTDKRQYDDNVTIIVETFKITTRKKHFVESTVAAKL